MIRRDALRALSLFGAAPLAFGKGKPPPKQPPPTPVPSAMTITLVPSGGDDTTQIMNALAALPSSGGEIVLNGAAFNVPNGITEAVPGLILRGIGHRVQGPGDAGLTTGTIIKSTHAGYTWTRTYPPSPTANEYRGALFDGITLTGVGAGGLLLQSCYNTIVDCGAVGYTNGRGFYALAPAISGGSAQENAFVDCGALNCYIGLESACNDQSEIRGFITLKNSAGGIHGQGYGIVLRDCSRVVGGKVEGNATGILAAGSPVQIIGVGSEDNALDIDLDRGTTSQSFTSNLVVGTFGTVRVGPWNFGDTVIGGSHPRLLTDVANPDGIVKYTSTVGAWNV